MRIGVDAEAVLHALVMTEGSIKVEALESVLPDRTESSVSRHRAMKNALTKLRRDKRFKLKISTRKEPVTMSRSQAGVSVDLWEFFELAQLKRYKQAARLISTGQEPVELEEDADHNKTWRPMLEKFNRVKSEVMAAVEKDSGRDRRMLDTRRLLLERSLVPGFGGEVPIGDVRDLIEPIDFPWRLFKDRDPQDKSLLAYLSDLLEREEAPCRVVVCGSHGAGKTLAAIAVYLKLTDDLEQADATRASRPIPYLDGEIEGRDEGFATDEWLEEYLREFDPIGPHGRRLVILTHADAFFRRAKRPLKEILGWRLFREGDVLLCCAEQFYATDLAFAGYATQVVKLEPWGPDTQLAYAAARYDKKVRAAYKAWREDDPTELRAELCSVPFHLIYVLSLVEQDPAALESISTRWRLFDQLARARLRAGGLAEEDVFSELAATAHRFHRAGASAGGSIGFDLNELRDFLGRRDPADVEARLDVLIGGTLLVPPSPGSSKYGFERPDWGSFFVACHLVRVLKLADRPEPVLKAFGKSFSAEVMDFCEEILADELALYEESIIEALRFALLEDDETHQRPAQRAIAREQVGYLLALLGDGPVREELARMVEAESPEMEEDDLVRSAIDRGLKGSRPQGSADALGHRGGT